MKKLLVILSILFFDGCSMLPPSADEFKKVKDKSVGRKVYQNGGDFYKIERKGNLRWFYHKSYNYSTKKQCSYFYVVDNNDTILDYKILTPNFCKLGHPAVW